MDDSVDLDEQTNCYEAMIEELHDKPWWKGLFILEYRTGTDPNNTSSIPYNKPAEKVIAQWFDHSSPPNKDIFAARVDVVETTRLR